MSEITAALDRYYDEQSSLPPVVGIRQDLGLPTTVLGWTNDAQGVTRQDTFTGQRIKARAMGVETDFDGIAGGYAWRGSDTVLSMAADVVRFRVLGDLALKAIRTDIHYRDVAREYFNQAKESLASASKAIEDATESAIVVPSEENVTQVSQSMQAVVRF